MARANSDCCSCCLCVLIAVLIVWIPIDYFNSIPDFPSFTCADEGIWIRSNRDSQVCVAPDNLTSIPNVANCSNDDHGKLGCQMVNGSLIEVSHWGKVSNLRPDTCFGMGGNGVFSGVWRPQKSQVNNGCMGRSGIEQFVCSNDKRDPQDSQDIHEWRFRFTRDPQRSTWSNFWHPPGNVIFECFVASWPPSWPHVPDHTGNDSLLNAETVLTV